MPSQKLRPVQKSAPGLYMIYDLLIVSRCSFENCRLDNFTDLLNDLLIRFHIF